MVYKLKKLTVLLSKINVKQMHTQIHHSKNAGNQRDNSEINKKEKTDYTKKA